MIVQVCVIVHSKMFIRFSCLESQDLITSNKSYWDIDLYKSQGFIILAAGLEAMRILQHTMAQIL